MVDRMHFNIKLDTFGGYLKDGVKAIGLTFTDRDTGERDTFAIPCDIAEDLGDELKRLASKLEEKDEYEKFKQDIYEVYRDTLGFKDVLLDGDWLFVKPGDVRAVDLRIWFDHYNAIEKERKRGNRNEDDRVL